MYMYSEGGRGGGCVVLVNSVLVELANGSSLIEGMPDSFSIDELRRFLFVNVGQRVKVDIDEREKRYKK